MKKVVLSNKFFEKLINEKASNSKQFKVEYWYNDGELKALDFKADNYYASLCLGENEIFFIERFLNEDSNEFEITNTKMVCNTKFHENSLDELFNILEDLKRTYPCSGRDDHLSNCGVREAYTFFIPN